MILESKNKLLPLLLISLISALVFIPFIGNCPLFDWDEVNFAECAREMVVSGDYSHVQLNFRPFWEKPPFFIWLQAISMNIFGVNEFAARLPNALCSIVTLCSLFVIGSRFHSGKFGITWCLLYAASLLPHFYFKTGIIDPWFNLFILLSVYNIHRFLNNPQGSREILNVLIAGFFLGMAVLTKGPAAMLYIALTVVAYLLWTKQLKLLVSARMIIFVITTLFVSGSWFLVEWLKGNGQIIEEFIEYQIRLFNTEDSGHGGPWYYHFIVLLVGCFPSSLIFIISYLKYLDLTPYQRHYRKMMLCLFWVVLILFSIIKTKIVHYSSICYFPLSFVAAIGLTDYFQTIRLSRPVRVLYWICAGLIAVLTLALGLFRFIKGPLLSSGIIKDDFAVLNLMADVRWSGFEWLISLLFLSGAFIIYRGIQKKQMNILTAGLALNVAFIMSTVYVFIPKVELHTQRAAIDFYKSCAQHSCYVETHAFKSYAYLFYSNRTPGDYDNPVQQQYIEHQLDEMEKEGHSRITSYAVANLLWMEYGVIDRPAYLVVKTTSEHELFAIPEVVKLYERNGYSFFVRMPARPAK